MLVAALALLAWGQPSSGLRRAARCPVEREREMDTCASRMGFLGDHTFKVPKNSSSMELFCNDLKFSISCIQSYSRDCLQGFTRQLLNSLLKRGKQQYSFICNTDESKENFMNKMSCLTDEKIPSFHSCMDASIARFEYIASRVRQDARLASLCCSYQIFNRDVDATLDKICGKPSQRAGSTNEFVSKIVGGTAGEFFGLICDQHRSLAECRASSKTSNVLNKLEEVSAKVSQGRLQPKNKSLVPVLLDILDGSA